MSPKGICGLATEATVALDMAEDEDRCHLTLLFQWDGVSVFPNCRGHLESLALRNWHDEPWEAVFDRGGDDIVTFPMDANSDVTIDAVMLAARGLADLPDIGGVTLRPQPAE